MCNGRNYLLLNLVLSVLSTLIRVIVNVGIVAIYSHSLDIQTFSYFVLGLFIAQITCVFIDSGINVEILRFSRLEDDKISYARLASSTSVRLTIGVSVVIVSFIIGVFIGELNQALVLSSSLLSGIFSSIIETYLISIKTKNKFKLEVVVVVMQAILLFLLSMISFLGEGFVLISILLPRIITLSWLMFRVGNFLEYRKSINLSTIYSYFSRLKYYSIDSIFSNLNILLDNSIIILVLGREIYGTYQPISRLYNSALAMVGAVSSFIIPLASTFNSNRKKWLILKMIFTIFGLLACIGMLIFSEYIISHFFGVGFIKESTTIRFLAAILFVRYMAAGSGSFLTLIGRQRIRAIINVVLTVTAFIVGYIYTESINHVLFVILISQTLLLVFYTIFGLVYSKRETITLVNKKMDCL